MSRLLITIGMVVLVAGTGMGTAVAGAPTQLRDDRQPARLTAAAAPFGDYVTRISFDVTTVEPALVTATGPATLTISGTMTNTGPEPLTDLAYRFHRGASLQTESAVRQELAAPAELTDQVQDDFTPLQRELPSGAQAPFTFTASITSAQGLAVSAPGVYPLMVNINGAVTLEGGPLAARIGELHLLLTVMGVPGSTPAPGGLGNTATPLPVNFVWPLVDRPHLGVGGIFLDDDLQTAIAPGGRLATLVDGLLDPGSQNVPGGAITVVLDPQLLDELDRMTSAYRVATPGQPQPSMTEMLQAEGSFASTNQPTTTAAATGPPGSTEPVPITTGGTETVPNTGVPATAPTVDPGAVNIPGTIAGTGQAAAASFLERLRTVTARYPTLVLPYGDPDVVAMVRAGLSGEVTTAVQQGSAVAERVLDAGTGSANAPITTMAFPIDGAVDSSTLSALRADGLTSALLSEDSLDLTPSAMAAAQVTLAGSDVPESIAAAVAQPDVLSGVDELIDQGQQSGWARRVNALTGVLAQQSLDSSTSRTVNPAIFTPDRRWSPDAPGLRVLTDLLATLGGSQVISGTSLADIAASATETGGAAYPDLAESRELTPGYLDRVKDLRADVASLQQSLQPTSQGADPALVLDPLDTALDAAGSTAFRTDPAVGDANLGTIESTAAGLRSGVEIASAGTSYTLASSSSPLVLTVQNNLPYDVPVRVEITGGEFVGLTVTNPDVQVVPAGRAQQVKIPAEVSRSGQFQVTAQLVGADGTRWGRPVQLSVNSTAYGALTVIIIVVAGGVLVLMVALRIVQRLRGKPDTTPGLPGDKRPDEPAPPALLDVIPPPNGPATSGPPDGRSAAEQVGTDRT